MFRYRRYRVFLVFAVVAVLALYKFSNSDSSWREQAASRFKHGDRENADPPHLNWQPQPQVVKETMKIQIDVPDAKVYPPKQTPPPIAPVERPVDKKLSTSKKAKPTTAALGGGESDRIQKQPSTQLVESGKAALEATLLSSSSSAIHWSKTKEHFPVPTESLIKLPTGKPKSIPTIQFKFKPETEAEKADREQKLDTIREVFKKSWTGYKKWAWLQDEVMPVSGSAKNPFAGWGATLVDALDTLWIMGLKDEFEEAAAAVDKIDFTTTTRPDIPLFETTIRYLGGLLAAYDIAGKKHENLLNKAKELAEILLSAFDTPNRMPQTYYYWRPDFASNAHPASNSVVLAEIGSLSMEFTRLAQLTGEHKYYDAIARITDNFEGFQNHTRLPGMWPTNLDASGCKKHDYSSFTKPSLQNPMPGDDSGWEEALKNGEYLKADKTLPLVKPAGKDAPSSDETLSPDGKKYIPLPRPETLVLVPNGPNPTWTPEPEEEIVWPGSGPDVIGKRKRQLDDPSPVAPEAGATFLPKPTCQNIGFGPVSEGGREEYTLGGMSDSTYEYLPKQYLLLGGQIEKYRTMYEKSIEVVNKYLVFRPMLPNNDDLLFSGKYVLPAQAPGETDPGELEPEYAHLTCFAGGMFAMGSKIFDRPGDLDIAGKLTEGCVYSYNMTATGIMPEAFDGVACASRKDCTWNETLYWEILDPNHESRLKQYKESMINYELQLKSASLWYQEQLKAMETEAPTPLETGVAAPAAQVTQGTAADDYDSDILNKRQLTDLDDVSEVAVGDQKPVVDEEAEEANPPTKVIDEMETPIPSKTLPTFPALYSPRKPLNHTDYVQNRIQEERLPLGVTRIMSKNYILRYVLSPFPNPTPTLSNPKLTLPLCNSPEAIESVWYMYRITGDPHWRDAGWRMFVVVNEHTTAEYGNSAIDDVTKKKPELNDSMESFWLAETLKYFYLLFCAPDVVSLDEWVLNTEAHPFRRPGVRKE